MIVLASKSPRRQELLAYITKDYIVKTAHVDESLPKGISPKDAVLYLSLIKAKPFANEEDIVIGADTVVAVDNVILGKPRDTEQCKGMLNMLSGKEHSVFTGVTIIKGKIIKSFAVETRVKFYTLTDDEINDYIKTNEPFDKAGGYGIQGYGSLLVERIQGDYFNVVGLPVSKLNRELRML